MKAYCVIIVFFVFRNQLVAQSDTVPPASSGGLSFKIGQEYAYIADPEFTDRRNGSTLHFQEHSLSFYAALRLKPRWWFGVNHTVVWNRVDHAPSGRYHLTGPFAQVYLFRPEARVNGWVKGGVYGGNYCTCDPAAPYQRPGLGYSMLGGGVSVRIAPHIVAELGLLDHIILNRFDGKYEYTRYMLGVEWRLFNDIR